MDIIFTFYITSGGFFLYFVLRWLFAFAVMNYLISYTGVASSINTTAPRNLAEDIHRNFYLKNTTYLLMLERVVKKMYNRGVISKEEFQYFEESVKINIENDSAENRGDGYKIKDIKTHWPTRRICLFLNKNDALIYLKHRLAWFLMFRN